MALHAAEDFQLGADLLFWHHYAQALRGMIAKDQYIPALKYQAIPSAPTKGKRGRRNASFELHPAWETAVRHLRRQRIQRYVAAMPGVCAAGLNSPDDAALFEQRVLAPPLLRVPPAQRCYRDTLYQQNLSSRLPIRSSTDVSIRSRPALSQASC